MMWIDQYIRENNQWLKVAEQFPVAFSQVREDGRLDEQLIRSLGRSSLKGIMIASGGCLATQLVSSQLFSSLVLVDMNPAQLALTRLKFQLLEQEEPDFRLALLGHAPMHSGERAYYLQKFCKSHDYPLTIFGDPLVVSELGLDYCGRYELLFYRLQQELAPISKLLEPLLQMDNPHQQSDYLTDHSAIVCALEQALTTTMALPNLVQLFGSQATQNAVRPFAKHFFEQTLYALQQFPARQNPYLWQFLATSFPPSLFYDWLTLPKQPTITLLTYQCMSMVEALDASTEKFDFIHLSNILDWLNEEEAHQLLSRVFAALNSGGVLMIRQLNSALNPMMIYPSKTWQERLATDLHRQDRSFFYPKLYVAKMA
ncbi:MAG TPA: DUF3419 family protein [Candidatus Nitrosotenuis sp.]|jgi:S-adenosylmethionine-diacylglycerol 3-amino-3-carboxypropyl transferase|nr:DUF3419 family protein [Candidatus Nitrosotenuis sp.]